MASWTWTDLVRGAPTDEGPINSMGRQLQGLSQRIASVDIFSSIGGCSLSTTSGAYVDITGAAKVFNKFGSAAESDLILMHVGVSGFSTVGSTGVKIGVNVNGVDYDVTFMLINTANNHAPLPTGGVRITGLPAAPYNIKLRALRTTGTGTITIDVNDTISWVIQEVSI